MPVTIPVFRRPDRWPSTPLPLSKVAALNAAKLPVKIAGMRGLGDNIFQRPFVKALARVRPVYLITPWPELYYDIPNVHFVHEATPLRTQAKNMIRQDPVVWVKPPRQVTMLRVSYGHATMATQNIARTMEGCFGARLEPMDLPAFPAFVPWAPAGRPVAVIRPVTERKEWNNTARSPKPEYVAEIARSLMDKYHVVSVADLKEGEEWLVGPAPPAHTRFHGGELDVRQLLGLVQSAALVVGGVGWIVPACIAAGTPLFCILGGCGGHNAPEKITDPRMDLSHVGYATPDRFCRCDRMQHTCDKTITALAGQWRDWRNQHCL